MQVKINNMQLKLRLVVFLLAISSFEIALVSCEEFVKVAPPETSLTGKWIFTNDATATASITGIYERMINFPQQFASAGAGSWTWISGLSADELKNFSSDRNQAEFYQNALSSRNEYVRTTWRELYGFIYTANAALEGLASSETVSNTVKVQLEGEAKFIRAFCHFYLVNLFGDVPWVNVTDYRVNSRIARSTVAHVYGQIVADLKDAQNLLTEDYISSGRTRPNKAAATALLARVYLYMGDWAKAESTASEVINSSFYKLESDLNKVFLRDSREAIWQLQSVTPRINTWHGLFFILTAQPTDVSLNDGLISAFEAGDYRSVNWLSNYSVGSTTYFFPFKYKVRILPSATDPVTEYTMVFRLAEQYLIKAEALAQQNNIAGAEEHLNIIRSRAGLTNLTAMTQTEVLLAIEQERRIELFAEWGHRWLDLKRTGRADDVLGFIKSDWQSTDSLFPLPLSEMMVNVNLAPQNPGY